MLLQNLPQPTTEHFEPIPTVPTPKLKNAKKKPFIPVSLNILHLLTLHLSLIHFHKAKRCLDFFTALDHVFVVKTLNKRPLILAIVSSSDGKS